MPSFTLRPSRLFLLLALVEIFGARAGAADSTQLTTGSTLETLTVGPTTYQQVRIRTISPQSAMIQHSGGMVSLRLRDLTPELQQRFGYTPPATADASAPAALSPAAAKPEMKVAPVLKKTARPLAAGGETSIDRLMRSFGEAPEVREKVDLRTRYNEFGLFVKNQGARPSCAVFAIVSALEFQSAETTGKPERFSEEYLLWATRKTLKRAPRVTAVASTPDDREPADEGFTLSEVVTALRAYGIPPRDLVPNRFSGKTIEEPPAEVVAEARASQRASIHLLPGRDGATLAADLVQALNAGVPVPIGISWPPEYNRRTGYLDKQRVDPRAGHAVTVVGYTSKTGRLEDTVFTFKNSWGVQWGIDGYGSATYEFLRNNLHTAVVLELR